MALSRGLILPLAFVAALAMLLVANGPALAAPSNASGADAALADHVDDCNLAFDAEGNLLVDGVALAGVELAAVEALLAADADLAAALELATDADADACLNLSLELIGVTLTVTINGHVTVCPTTTAVDADGNLVISGVVFSADIVDSDLAALLAYAATADVAVCAGVTITDNAVTADVTLNMCVSAILNADGSVSITLDDRTELTILGDAFMGGTGALEVGVEAELGLEFSGSFDFAGDTVLLTARIVEIDGCGEDTGGGGATPTPIPTTTPTPSPSPTDDAGGRPTPTPSPGEGGDGGGGRQARPTPPTMLPDAALPYAARGSSGVLLLAGVALLSLGLVGYMFASRTRVR